MLSHVSKRHNSIAMMSNNPLTILKLNYDVINFMLLSDDVTCQFVLSSVVSKHLLLPISVLCLLLDQQIDVYISFSNKNNSQQE